MLATYGFNSAINKLFGKLESEVVDQMMKAGDTDNDGDVECVMSSNLELSCHRCVADPQPRQPLLLGSRRCLCCRSYSAAYVATVLPFTSYSFAIHQSMFSDSQLGRVQGHYATGRTDGHHSSRQGHQGDD